MDRRQKAAPVISGNKECYGRRSQIVLEEPRAAIDSDEQPEPHITVLPCRAGEKRWHGSACGLSRQQAGKKITTRAEESHQRPLVHGPWIVTGAAVQRRRRKVAAASSAGKKDVDL